MRSRRIYASHLDGLWTSRYVALSSGTGAFYSIFVHRLARLFNASFRPRLAAVALASSLGLHLHQVGQRTFTSKLLSMPSTQRSRAESRGAVKDLCTARPHNKPSEDSFDYICNGCPLRFTLQPIGRHSLARSLPERSRRDGSPGKAPKKKPSPVGTARALTQCSDHRITRRAQLGNPATSEQ